MVTCDGNQRGACIRSQRAPRPSSASGYLGWQMADVAGNAISAGALYSYVESKEALLHLALSYVFEIEPGRKKLSSLSYQFPQETLNWVKHGDRADDMACLSERLQKRGTGPHTENIAEVAAELLT